MICHPCEKARLCELDTTESLLLLQGTGLRWHTADWLLLSSELPQISEHSFPDVHSLEWSNQHLSDRFRWKDSDSMKLHCLNSLVKVSRILDNSRWTHVQHFIPSTPWSLQHTILLKDPEVFAILHSREYFVLIEAFRMYWDERSIPISRHHHFSLSFSLIQPHFHPSHIYSRLTHSSIFLSHPFSHSITPFNTYHLHPIITPNSIPSLVLVQLTLTKHRSIQ